MSIHISNRFDIVWNIQIVIRMLYHSFKTLFLLGLFLFNGNINSGKSFAKIGSCLQIDTPTFNRTRLVYPSFNRSSLTIGY